MLHNDMEDLSENLEDIENEQLEYSEIIQNRTLTGSEIKTMLPTPERYDKWDISDSKQSFAASNQDPIEFSMSFDQSNEKISPIKKAKNGKRKDSTPSDSTTSNKNPNSSTLETGKRRTK
jgi:hypothetical protein